jgi:hypothetical protein
VDLEVAFLRCFHFGSYMHARDFTIDLGARKLTPGGQVRLTPGKSRYRPYEVELHFSGNGANQDLTNVAANGGIMARYEISGKVERDSF